MGKRQKQKQKQKHGTRTRENREPDIGNGARTARLQELIREEVNFILRNEVRDPRFEGVEITMVELAGDGSCARLWFSAADERDRKDAYERIAGFLRVRLAESLGLKRTPEVHFRRDPATRALARFAEGEL
jgi:ribosome-binding factor A